MNGRLQDKFGSERKVLGPILGVIARGPLPPGF
jgi:hypothetical protein